MVEQTRTVLLTDVREEIVLEDKNIWPTVAAKGLKGHKRSQTGTMKRIKIKVQEAHINTDICITRIFGQ